MIPTQEVLETSYTVADSGCWEWSRSVNPRTGYGVLWRGEGVYLTAHVASYEHHVGPVPEGLVLDHLCRNRACINPEHLEPVTSVENVMRGESPMARNARKQECVNGHPFDEANTYIHRGRRLCRTCRREAGRRRDAKARIAREAGRA